MFVPNFKILGAEVIEKSLAEKKSLHTEIHRRIDRHSYGKDKNYIPLFFICLGGVGV